MQPQARRVVVVVHRRVPLFSDCQAPELTVKDLVAESRLGMHLMEELNLAAAAAVSLLLVVLGQHLQVELADLVDRAQFLDHQKRMAVAVAVVSEVVAVLA
jgi:hypothetical protein